MKYLHNEFISVIFGGSSGIGLQIAKDISVNCDKTIIICKNEEKAKGSFLEIHNCDYFICDMNNSQQLIMLSNELTKRYQRIDYLVFSTGIFHMSSIEEITEEIWDKTININLKSAYFAIKHLLPLIKNGVGKSIVLVSSVLAERGAENVSVYSISKAGLVSLTKSLSIELSKFNIRINCVSPSYIDTPMIKSLLEKDAIYNKIKQDHPLGRIGTTNDISNFVSFLTSNSSSWITGQNFIIDGGRSVKI